MVEDLGALVLLSQQVLLRDFDVPEYDPGRAAAGADILSYLPCTCSYF